MFYFGWAGWKPMTKAPKDAINITSVARMWSFSFQYENGKQSPDLVIPVNTPVKDKTCLPGCYSQSFYSCFQGKIRYGSGKRKNDVVSSPDRLVSLIFIVLNIADCDTPI